MDYTIRLARPDDMPQVWRLIRELALFEKEPEAVEVTAERLVADGFGADPKFHCFVAEEGREVVGIALVYPRYSTWKGPALHLEDLIVTERMRGRGVGTALFDRVVRYGAEQGVKRIVWDVLEWNRPAIEFYEAQGAKIISDWRVVHMDEAAIGSHKAVLS